MWGSNSFYAERTLAIDYHIQHQGREIDILHNKRDEWEKPSWGNRQQSDPWRDNAYEIEQYTDNRKNTISIKNPPN